MKGNYYSLIRNIPHEQGGRGIGERERKGNGKNLYSSIRTILKNQKIKNKKKEEMFPTSSHFNACPQLVVLFWEAVGTSGNRA